MWLAAADFNGDGKPDLAIEGQSFGGSGRLAILLNAKITPKVVNLNAASFLDGPLAAESIATAFDSTLAVGRQQALTLPLPTNLGGNSVIVQDSAGNRQLSPLFYVSPFQVNYEIPVGTSDGTARVTFSASDGTNITDTLEIVRVAPGLFYTGPPSQSVAVGYVTRVKPDGSQSNEPIVKCDTFGACSPMPIDLSSTTDQVILVLFGTGIRNNRGDMVFSSVGGTSAPVLYAGPQGAYAGLDQVNIQLSHSLAGRGLAPVVFGSRTYVSNSIYVNIR